MKRIIILFATIIFAWGQWSSEPGQALNLGSGIQPQLAAAPDGGLYVAWLSEPNFHIYLQRLDAQGVPLWQRDGILVSDAANSSWIAVFHLNLLADSEGNAIITAVDTRSGNWEVRAYKIDPQGQQLWGAGGLALSNSGTPNISPRLALVPSDNSLIVGWTENYESLRLQRLQADGSLLWGPQGIQIMDASANLLSPQMRITADDQVLVQWIRQTGNFPALNSQVMVQSYDLDGQSLWSAAAQGPAVGFPLGNWSQDLLANAAGAYSSWTELAGDNQTSKLRLINLDGQLTWFTPVEASTQSTHFRVGARLAPVGSTDQVYTVWNESDANQNNRGIIAQRLSAAGNRLWGASGIPVEALSASVFMDLQVSHVGTDLLVAYVREANTASNIIAARMSSDGDHVWAGNTVALTNSGVSKADLAMVAGPECWFLSWSEAGSIRAHCLLADGSLGAPPIHTPGMIHVPADFSSIQAAIDHSLDGDTILVQDGTYFENLDFLGKAIILASEMLITGDPNHMFNTIIDGGQQGSVIIMTTGEELSTQVMGLTLQHGSGHFADPDDDGVSSYYGGAVYLQDASPRLTSLYLKNNTVSGGGGGALFCFQASPVLDRVLFEYNTSDDVGGAIYARMFSDLQINRSHFSYNSCTDVGGVLYARDSSDIRIDHSYMIANSSQHAGGALGFKNGCQPVLNHVTLWDNTAAHFGGAIYANASLVSVVNSILWDNGQNEVHFADFDDPSQILVAYSNLKGGPEAVELSGNGTILWDPSSLAVDPLLLFPMGLHLNSPCRDAGTLYFEFEGLVLVDDSPEDYLGTAPDMGFWEAEPTSVDFLPLSSHYRWQYASDMDGFVISLGDSILLNEHPYFEVDSWYAGESHITALRVAGNRVFAWLDTSEVLLYDFGATLGESWNFPGADGSLSTMTLVAVGDTIITELGPFTNCTRISRFIASDYEYVEWFAEDVGLVQRDVITIAGPRRYHLVSMGSSVAIDPSTPAIPASVRLMQNFPNPFNPSTEIAFQVFEPGPVQVLIYDMKGNQLVTLHRGDLAPGPYGLTWDGMNQLSQGLAGGVYFCQIQARDTRQTIKMIYLK